LKLNKEEEKLFRQVLSNGEIPAHIAIIMDGNGRWAKRKGLPRVAGHRKGVESVRKAVRLCGELGVKYLTLYTFSTENWKRPKDEVSMLMRLIVKTLQTETNELHKNNVKVSSIGNIEQLPYVVQKELLEAENTTKNNTKLTLTLALSYSGRWEILQAVKTIATKVKNGELLPDEIDEEVFSSFLQTANMPDPDLLIRSGGEFRISNYLLWQAAYSEIYITKTLWPNFTYKNLLLAIENYQKRERRFGLISEQIRKFKESNNVNEALFQKTN